MATVQVGPAVEEVTPSAASRLEDEVKEVEDDTTAGEASHKQAGDEPPGAGEQVGDVQLAEVEGDARQAQDDCPSGQAVEVVGVGAAQQDEAHHVQQRAWPQPQNRPRQRMIASLFVELQRAAAATRD